MVDIAYKPVEKVNSRLSIPLDTKEKNVFDYILKFGRRVALRVISDSSGSLIYTVPEGMAFFLLTASTCTDMAADNYSKLYIQTGEQVLIEMVSKLGSTVQSSPTISENSYSIPLRINASERIIGESTLKAVHVIVGYEVSLSEIY